MQWEAISQPANSTRSGRPWTEAPLVGQLSADTRAELVDVLTAYTSTPQFCWICIWKGFAGVDELLAGSPLIELLNRSYFLLRAPLSAIRTGQLFIGHPFHTLGPSIWWPDDLAWCVATEIDFRFTYVGATELCIRELLVDQGLEALPAKIDDRADYFGDRVNASPTQT
jgi:hypothetical protein